MINKLCGLCKKRPKRRHFNSKWCVSCALELRKRPRSTLTKEQIHQAESLIGKMDRRDIAQELGTSISNLKRAFKNKTLAFHNKYKSNPALVKQVCEYYEKHGKLKTQKKFPTINLRSVVERYPHKKRQIRWTDDQIAEAARMATFVTFDKQAKIFNRPGANEGSIKSLWMKKFNFYPAQLHGMCHNMGKHIVSSKCPQIKLNFMRLYLWVDMEKHLLIGVPRSIRDGIKTMAHFQRWIYNTDNPKKTILTYINK